MANAEQVGTSGYQSLAGLIESHMNADWADVPADLQEVIRARCQLLAFCWDDADANGRKKAAKDHDQQNDPANSAENGYWFDLGAEVSKAEGRKRELELSNPQGIPSEVVHRNNALEAISRRLRHLEVLWKCPPFTVRSWNELSDAELAEYATANGGAGPAARTIKLPAGRTHVKYGELAHLIADALWPDQGANDERLRYGVARENLIDELAQAVKSEALPVKDPTTLGPHPFPVGAALQRALVTVEDLRAFVKGRGLSVLLQFTVNEDGGATSYHATQEDHNARTAERKARIAQRQVRGYFTLHEASEILATANGFDAQDYLRKRIRPAVESGALTLRDPIDQGEVTGRPCRTTDWVTPADVNRWLEKDDRYSYRWPAPFPAVRAEVDKARGERSALRDQWELVTPERWPGYREPLYAFLKLAHAAGKARPSASDVIDEWNRTPPYPITSVDDGVVSYQDATGVVVAISDTRGGNLDAIRQAINRLTRKTGR